MTRIDALPPDAQELVRAVPAGPLRDAVLGLWDAMVHREQSPEARRAAEETAKAHVAAELHRLNAFADQCLNGQHGREALAYAEAYWGAQARNRATLRLFEGRARSLVPKGRR